MNILINLLHIDTRKLMDGMDQTDPADVICQLYGGLYHPFRI